NISHYDSAGNLVQSDQVLIQPPIASWHFGEASGSSLTDSSNHGRTGTIHGNVTRQSALPPGANPSAKSLQFGGTPSDYAKMGVNVLTGSFTVSMYFKVDSVDTSGDWHLLFIQAETQLLLQNGH